MLTCSSSFYIFFGISRFKLRRIDRKLHCAVTSGGSLEKVMSLIREGADINSRNITNNTPLWCAIVYGHEHLLGVLSTPAMLQEPVQPGSPRFYTHLAISQRKSRALKELLKLGADVNIMLHGQTLLSLALMVRSYRCAAIILQDSQLNILLLNRSADHPLKFIVFDMYRCASAYEMTRRGDMLTLMLQKGVSTNNHHLGWLPLQSCIQNPQLYWWVVQLADQGADVNAVQPANGLYPLLTATLYDNFLAFELLLSLVDMCKTSGVVESAYRHAGKNQSALSWFCTL